MELDLQGPGYRQLYRIYRPHEISRYRAGQTGTCHVPNREKTPSPGHCEVIGVIGINCKLGSNELCGGQLQSSHAKAELHRYRAPIRFRAAGSMDLTWLRHRGHWVPKYHTLQERACCWARSAFRGVLQTPPSACSEEEDSRAEDSCNSQKCRQSAGGSASTLAVSDETTI